MSKVDPNQRNQMIPRLIIWIPLALFLIAAGLRLSSFPSLAEQATINVNLLKSTMPVAMGGEPIDPGSLLLELDQPLSGFQSRALAYLAATYGDYVAGERYLVEGLADTASADLTQFELCLLYWNAGQRDAALTACRGTQVSTHYWLQKGYEANVRGDADEALAYFQMASFTDPLAPEAWRQFGHSLLAKGYYEQAIIAYERVLAEVASPSADIFTSLGSAYLKIGNSSMARTVVNQGLVSFADQRPLYSLMAEAYRMDGDYRAADGWYARLLQRWPSDAQTWAARGEMAQAEGDTDNAIDFFQMAITNQPNGIGYWLNLASAAKETGDIALATEAYNRVLQLRPNDANLMIQAGRFLLDTGNAREAGHLFEQILIFQPDNQTAAAYLAEIDAATPSP